MKLSNEDKAQIALGTKVLCTECRKTKLSSGWSDWQLKGHYSILVCRECCDNRNIKGPSIIYEAE